MQISSRPRSPRKIIWKEYEEYKEYRTHNLVCRVDSSSIGRILGVTEGAAVGVFATGSCRPDDYCAAGHEYPSGCQWLAAMGAAGAVGAMGAAGA